jgi:hypothetical protein
VIEQLGFEDFTLDEVTSLCLDRPGKWTEYRETDALLIEDIERLWSKHVLPKRAKKAEDAAAADAFVSAAANDNEPQENGR